MRGRFICRIISLLSARDFSSAYFSFFFFRRMIRRLNSFVCLQRYILHLRDHLITRARDNEKKKSHASYRLALVFILLFNNKKRIKL